MKNLIQLQKPQKGMMRWQGFISGITVNTTSPVLVNSLQFDDYFFHKKNYRPLFKMALDESEKNI
ncbi:hypothetical protein BVZ25_20155 [Klebsiella quasipneumoniae]|nr:hypothetical protein BVZ25_20155 [Klebsiella quasipneumoniae]